MQISGIEKIDQPKTGAAREIQLRETSKQMEASFLNFVFKAMEKTVPKTSLMGGDNNLSTMLFSTTMAEAVANQGGVGFAEQIYQSLKSTDNIPELNDVTLEKVSNALDAIHLMNAGGMDK